MIDFEGIKKIHLMGICGTAMASMAGLLKDKGYEVTGSDTQAYPPMSIMLEQLGIPIMIGYERRNLDHRPDLVIVGNVIRKEYEEAQALLESNIPYLSFPEALNKFVLHETNNIVVAGTHGKTTTTSMMAYILEKAGINPGFLIGGVTRNFSKSFKNPVDPWFVIEGDEYDTAFFDKNPKFLHYRPRYVTLTSIEFDHADIYKDLSAVCHSFARLIELIPENGHLLYAAGDANIKQVLNNSKNSITAKSYGIEEGDFQARNLIVVQDGTEFEFYCAEKGLSHQVFIPVFGDFNVMNALSSLAHMSLLNMEINFSRPLEGYLGVKRRQEVLGSPRGVTVVEDFAHHPTAVTKTLNALRSRFKQGRLHAIFEPRSATSRSSFFQKEYEQAFNEADFVYLAVPYKAKAAGTSTIKANESVSDGLDVLKITQGLNNRGRVAETYSDVNQIVDAVCKKAETGDTVVIMSNGGFDGIYIKMLKSLESASIC